MDQGTAENFILMVWILASVGLFALLRRKPPTPEWPNRRLPTQLAGSLIGGALVTAALLVLNLLITGGTGLTGSQF